MPEVWNIGGQDPYTAMQVGMENARKNRLADIDLAQKVQAEEQTKALNALMKTAFDPVTGKIDVNKLYGGLASQGYGAAIPGMQTAETERALKQAQAAKHLTDAQAQSLQNNREALAPVKNQAGWTIWRNNTLAQYGNVPEIAQMIPENYSPENKQDALLKADQLLEQHFVTQDYGSGTRVLAMPKYGTGKARTVEGTDIAMGVSPNRPTTSITTKLESAEAGAKGSLNVETYKGIQTAANAARALAPKLSAIRSKLNEGFETGVFAPAKAQAAAFLSAIGVKDTIDPATGKKVGPLQYATDAQTFKAAAQERVLERQLEQKGVQTTSDAARMEQTFARLGNTTEANRFLVDVADAQGKMAVQQQKFWDDWWNKNRTYEGVEQAWNDGPGSKSIFDMPGMGRYLTAGAPISVSAPNKKTYTFPDQASADKFKKAAGIK